MTPQDEKELRKKVKKAERTPEQHRAALRRKVKYFYDLQRLRIQAAGRGKPKGDDNEIQLNEIDLHLLEVRAQSLSLAEKLALQDIADHLSTDGFYRSFLKGVKGVGPTMAGVILSEIDITRADTASKVWAYAGLAPVPARRCKKCNQIVKARAFNVAMGEGASYEHTWKTIPKGCKKVISHKDAYASARAARPEKGQKLPYNKFLKTKLIGVLAGCLLKCNSPYRKFYDDYKHRWESAGKGMSDGHRHNAAMRYMIKMLLLDIWREWRTFEKLPVRDSYQEQYLGHKHSA